MAEKLPPECVECYSDIKEHSKQVFGEMDKTFKSFLETSSTKQDESNSKNERKFNQMFTMNLFLLGIFATAIGYIFISNSNKANSSEVLMLKDAKNLFELRDKYSDQRYVLKPGQTSDNSNYEWLRETIFERATRSGKRLESN